MVDAEWFFILPTILYQVRVFGFSFCVTFISFPLLLFIYFPNVGSEFSLPFYFLCQGVVHWVKPPGKTWNNRKWLFRNLSSSGHAICTCISGCFDLPVSPFTKPNMFFKLLIDIPRWVLYETSESTGNRTQFLSICEEKGVYKLALNSFLISQAPLKF
jgi:hypothetical protein